MRVVLAGCEGEQFFHLAAKTGIKNILFSYYHLPLENKQIFDQMNNYGCECICDSGLFTMMFGAGKGKSYDLNFMRDYTRKYIENAKKFSLNNYSIVECDVHKLLGIEAVFELRKQFEDSGLNVIYVWHREEGIEGLKLMAKKYKYIAISVPELRVLFKQVTSRYQDGVKDLLDKLYKELKFLPKIHLLGNTVQETMETSLAYSCDSTSWLSGGRYGRGMYFDGRNIKSISIHEDRFKMLKAQVLATFPDLDKYLKTKYTKEKTLDYMVVNSVSAWSYKLYQDYLDRNYKWVGLNGRN